MERVESTYVYAVRQRVNLALVCGSSFSRSREWVPAGLFVPLPQSIRVKRRALVKRNQKPSDLR